MTSFTPNSIIILLLGQAIYVAGLTKVSRLFHGDRESSTKKLLVLLSFLGVLSGYVYAQTVTKNLDVSVDVPKVVSISVEDVVLGTLNPLTGISKNTTATIRSNHYSWTIKTYAQKGVLTVFDGQQYDLLADTIPYILTFNISDTNPAQKFTSSGSLPTTLATALSATFSRKTTGGKVGESFIFTINVSPEEANTNWDAGNYQDILYVTVIAN